MLFFFQRAGNVFFTLSVHYPPEIYYRRRIGLEAVNLVDSLIAWGEANRQLLVGCPGLVDHERIKVLGNSRIDLLRPELASYFEPETDRLRQEHGDFILINSNFGSINCYDDRFNLFRKENGQLVAGRGSRGMPRDYAEGLYEYRQRTFAAFRGLVPTLAEAFPKTKIVLRPHPAENHADWQKLLAAHKNVAVISEGNVIPWLRACSCLIHNGCTTAVEGYLLGTRIIAYVPFEDERFEFALPNQFSRQATDLEALINAVCAVTSGADTADPSMAERITESLSSLEGPLASEQILNLVRQHSVPQDRGRFDARLAGQVGAEFRRLKKTLKRLTKTNRHNAGFTRHRFPELTVSDLEDRLTRMDSALDRKCEVRVRAITENVFEIFS